MNFQKILSSIQDKIENILSQINTNNITMSSLTQTICPLKQFTLDTGVVLARGQRSPQPILPWKGITREQVAELVKLAPSRTTGAFHSWCIHKKSKKLYDVYSDPTTQLGSIVKEIMMINDCDKLIYEEYEKTPKYLERLLSTENEKCKKYPWFNDYKDAQDWSGNGYCFQRAHAKHKENKKWKIKFGVVWIENSQTGKRYNLEGNFGEEIDDGLIFNNLDAIARKVFLGTITKERAKELACFFMSHSLNIVEDFIDDMAVKSQKTYAHARDVSRALRNPSAYKHPRRALK